MISRSVRWPATARLTLAAALSAFALAGCGSAKSSAPAAVAVALEASRQTDSVEVDVSLVPDTLVVIAADAADTPVSGVTVIWSVPSGTGSLSTGTSVTAGDGTAVIVFTPNAIVGTDLVSASALALTPATFTVSVTPGPPWAVSPVSGNGLSGNPGATLSQACVLRVTDAAGNAVPNVLVMWQAGGGGALSASSTTTDATGQASATLTLGPVAGIDTVTAGVAGVTPATFIETAN